MIKNLAFFTVVARNYLAQAYVLGDSIKQFHPDFKFYIFLVDDINHDYESEVKSHGFSAIYPENIEVLDYQNLVFKYNIVEASTAVKPLITKFLLNSGVQGVMYIDPDVLCFRRLVEIFDLLERHSIIITPHILSPVDDDYLINDRFFLWSGAYNLGFLAVKNTNTTHLFLDWWNQRLMKYCLMSNELNLAVDQKWIDLVPSLFEDVLIYKNPAYNVAYWNLHERFLIKDNDGWIVSPNNEPLAFIHFSSFDVERPEIISKSLSPKSIINAEAELGRKTFSFDNRPDLKELFNKYLVLLTNANYKLFSSMPYGYSNYKNGEKISELERILYLTSSYWQNSCQSPFEVGTGTFFEACRNSGIKSKGDTVPKPGTNKLMREYTKVSPIFQFSIRLLVRFLGADKYALLARYITKQFLLYNHAFLIKKSLPKKND